MSTLIPPGGASDKEIETFVASLRKDARDRVRAMLAAGAPEDEIAEYIESVESESVDDEVPPENEV